MPVFERSQTRYRPLAFTDSPGSGSLEHFHHFMWSYFLPAFSLILDDPARKTQAVRYQLASCGPLMDRITREILTTCHIVHELIPANDPAFRGAEALAVPRWDWDFERSHPDGTESARDLPAGLAKASVTVRNLLLRIAHDRAPDINPYEGKTLLIRRSAEPDYFRPGGGAEPPFYYGAGRRTLRGLDETRAALNAAGHNAVIFDCGAHDIFSQILAFSSCRGIVAIRGAELVHLFWMRPGSQAVIVLIPEMDRLLPIHARLCRANGVQAISLPIMDQGPAPEITPEVLLPLLTRKVHACA